MGLTSGRAAWRARRRKCQSRCDTTCRRTWHSVRHRGGHRVCHSGWYGIGRRMMVLVAVAAAVGTTGGVASAAQQHTAPPSAPHRLTVVILGTGPTAPDARPSGGAVSVRLQQMIDSTMLPFHVTSAGRFGESSAYAVTRVDSLVGQSMDVFVLETGAQDAVRGLGADSTRTNIRQILHRVRATHPESWVCLVRETPPTALAASDTAAFRALYGSLARSERAIVLPAPTDSLWPALEPILRKVAALRMGS